jgi:small conductance mechanosensitive channel
LETLLPLARKAALVVIVVVVTMTVLSELGVNIGPLLAGAGVVGLAVGFGAQTLVKDIITGAFILIEDSISIDDFVDVGGHEGTVESLSIRTICIRDTEGSVHTVPFSAVTSIINYTRDFGISKIEIGVAYREDIDHVIEVINELGEELLQDPEIGKDILEPLVVQGVQRLDDSAVTIRLKIKTVPGMQWAMRREFFRRVKKRFDERGIEIPFPHRTIYFGVDQGGKAPPAHVQVETD